MPNGNIVVWAPWCCLDLTWTAPATQDVSAWIVRERIAGEVEKLDRTELGDQAAKALRRVAKDGLTQDEKFRASGKVLDFAAQQLAEQKGWLFSEEVGGNPAISAVRHAYLACGAGRDALPEVAYVGVCPETVQALVDKPGTQKGDVDFLKVFRGRIASATPYRTVAAAGTRAKLMMNFAAPEDRDPLRDASDDPEAESGWTFDRFADGVYEACHSRSGAQVLALGATTCGTPDQWAALLSAVDRRFSKAGGSIRYFVSTGGFRRSGGSPDDNAKAMYENVFSRASIVSMSLEELEVLYRAVKGADPDKPAAQKLRELDLDALKICHSSSGAIVDVSRVPDGLITHPGYVSDPGSGFMKQSLQWACDGTTAALDDPGARRASFSQVQAYSANVPSRQKESLLVEFLHPSPLRQWPSGMVRVAAPYVTWPRGSLVGLGAIFDGLLLAFLLRQG